MSRLVKSWAKAKPLALGSSSKGGCKWVPDGQSFSLTWNHIRNREIDLECLRSQVVKEADELKQALVTLFPYIDFSTFLLSKVNDDVESPMSLFDREDNKVYFKPFIDDIWAHLGRDHDTHPGVSPTTPIFTSTGKFLQNKGKNWLTGPRDILQKSLAHFYRTSGIPPRAWQTSDLLYRGLGSYLRNFRVLRHNISFIGNPKAKQRDKLMYDAFWALAPHLGLVLIFYLGVIRPVEIEILKMLGIPTIDHEHYIFVHTKKMPLTSPYNFNTATINQLLHKDTVPELAYESRAYRNVMQSIFDNHLARLHPDTVEKLLRQAADGQAQHTEDMHDGHYALDEIAQGTGIPLSKRDHQFGVSRAFQSWFNFIPGDFSWSTHANYRPVDEIELHKHLALDIARRRIIEHYHITNGEKPQRAQRVAEVMVSKPFLLGSEVSSLPYLSFFGCRG